MTLLDIDLWYYIIEVIVVFYANITKKIQLLLLLYNIIEVIVVFYANITKKIKNNLKLKK